MDIIQKKYIYHTYYLMIVLLTTAFGCNSSYGGHYETDTISPDSDNYLFYTDDTGKLIAIDPNAPASNIKIEMDHGILGCLKVTDLKPCRFAGGVYNHNTQVVTDYKLDALAYPSTNGRFYKVSARRGDGLTPIQISNETNADLACKIDTRYGIYRADDYSDINQSQLVYELPGPDKDCSTANDNIWKMIELGMSELDAPVNAFAPLLWLINLESDGSIDGWLVNDAGSLRRCDKYFLNCSDTIAHGITKAQLEFNLGRNNYVLRLDRQLYIYNGTDNSLSKPFLTLPQSEAFIQYTVDDNNLYFVVLNTIYQAPIDGSSSATAIGEEISDSPSSIMHLNVIDDSLVYVKSADSESDSEIKRLDMSDGTYEILVTIKDADRAIMGVQQDRIFFGFYESGYIPLHAGIMDKHGNIQFEAGNTAWVGTTIEQSLDLGKNHSEWDKFILGEVIDSEIDSGISLQLFDNTSKNQLINLGIVLGLKNLKYFNCGGRFQADVLCEAFSTSKKQNDIFYLNTSISESLTRVTKTPDISESAVFH